MDARISTFLSKHQIASLTTLLADGTPHAAAIHFSYRAEPLEFYFLTKDTSRKVEGLQSAARVAASVVVGFSDDELITLQLDGEVERVIDAERIAELQQIHFEKNPDTARYKENPAYIFLVFKPRWWRFTDYNTRPATILSSEQAMAEAVR
jgi:general stress protein 26